MFDPSCQGLALPALQVDLGNWDLGKQWDDLTLCKAQCLQANIEDEYLYCVPYSKTRTLVPVIQGKCLGIRDYTYENLFE
jgi:hypothetical protein